MGKCHADEDPDEIIEKHEAYIDIEANTDPANILILFLTDLYPIRLCTHEQLFLDKYRMNLDIKFPEIRQDITHLTAGDQNPEIIFAEDS